jgi:hypothetical protein
MAACESLPNLHTKRVRVGEGEPCERRAAATAWLAPCRHGQAGSREKMRTRQQNSAKKTVMACITAAVYVVCTGVGKQQQSASKRDASATG